MSNMHMKRCSGSLIIRKFKMQTTLRHGYTHIRMSSLKIAQQPWLVQLSWLEHRPINRKVTSSIPCLGTSLGCRFGEATDQCFSLFPSFPFFLKSISMSSGEHFLNFKNKNKLKNGAASASEDAEREEGFSIPSGKQNGKAFPPTRT